MSTIKFATQKDREQVFALYKMHIGKEYSFKQMKLSIVALDILR